MNKRVATYSRCSTQRDQKPEVQIEELRRYCTARGWSITEEIVDHGYSGTRADRPGLRRLLELARSRQVDVIVVVKLDRLFRSLKHLVVALQEFSDLSVEFVSIKDQLDMTTSAGRLMTNLLACFSEFEADLIRERTIMGLEHARNHGKILGRPRSSNFDEIRSLRSNGLSLRQIQKKLRCSVSTIYRALEGAPKTPQNLSQSEHLETRGSDG